MDMKQNDNENFDLDVKRYLAAVRRHWIAAAMVFAVVMGASLLLALWEKPVYRATARLLFQVDRVSLLTGLGEGAQDLETVVSDQNPLVTEREIISSDPLLKKVITSLNLVDREKNPLDAQSLAENLEVNIIKGTDIIELTYESQDPRRAAAIANELAKVYIKSNLESVKEEAFRTRVLIEQQLSQAIRLVRENKNALRDFKQQNNIVSLETQSENLLALIKTMDEEILVTQAKLEEARARSNNLGLRLELTPEEAIIVSDLSQSSGVQAVLKDLQATRQELAIQQEVFVDGSPALEKVRDREKKLNLLLEQEIDKIAPGINSQVPERFLQVGEQKQALIAELLRSEVQISTLVERLENLNNQRDSYNEQVALIPILEQKQAELLRRTEAAQENYQSLLKQQQQLRIAEDQILGNVSLLQAAAIPTSSSSSIKKNLMIGGLLGALMATTIIFIFEKSDAKKLNRLENDFKY
ncbi:MAG: hypothetical protein GVY04_20190 [Cyanobacteria bacterium]|jgi:uncharacterized protein involved in exopolysaccharide biosynthesis|nr:hypothetical protein [Cyanobacteria bacterium GSL.Bin1]